ncbi:MAG: hypothetical protein ABW173_02625 [Sphingomonas sp.]
MSERFIFGVPLIARDSTDDWPLVEHLFALTLRSVLAQSDPDFLLILAAHDVPAAWARVADDPRFVLLRADWPPTPPTPANDDGDAKKSLIKERVRALGGGLLMFLDADDWVSGDLVATARAGIGPADAGALLANGFALDHASLRLSPFPIARAFDGLFHRLCGSSTIGRVDPASDDPVARDPHDALGSHHDWGERALNLGVSLAQLDARGVYMVGTGQNHSERQGPFAEWRREVTRIVRDHGTPLDEELAEAFGQRLADIGDRSKVR